MPDQSEPEIFTEPFEGAVLVCMVCSSTFDATGWGFNELHCTVCGTDQTVILRPSALAHALI